MNTNSARFTSVVAAIMAVGSAFGQSTAFTYQGRLTNSGSAANGLHDFRFRLFDTATGGAQVASTICVDNVSVSNGLFTLQLDFGQQYASTAQRHLEIDVRSDSGLNCSNAGGFVTLAPRQQVTATPLASHAKSAFALDASDGSPASAVFVDSTGNVGIGTVAPVEPLHVAFPVPVLNLQDSDSGANGQVGLVSFRDSSGVENGWMGFGSSGNPHAHFMNNRVGGNIALGAGALERLTVLPTGNVGIGTTVPAAKLDVRGNIKLGANGQFFAPAGEENLRIIRGTCNVTTGGGEITVDAGTGFTPSILGQGTYLVTFTTPFNGVPTVTASGKSGVCTYVAAIGPVTSGSVEISIDTDVCGGSGAWRGFYFIAVGPR